MRIAVLAPLVSTSRVPHMGGGQELIRDFCHGLQQRGHDVTLFARDDEFAPGIPTQPVIVQEPADSVSSIGNFFLQTNLLLDLFLTLQEQHSAFDILHVQTLDWAALAYSILLHKLPIVHTLHLPVGLPEVNTALRVLHNHGHPVTLITVSQACARTYASYSPIDHIIYNGIDVNEIPFNNQVPLTEPLIFAGRIVPEKGVETAIEIATQANRKLLIAGSIGDRQYFATCIAPKIEQSNGQITYLGFLQRRALWPIISRAAGFLFPIQWEEPFGLVAVEAMATGTPVIAFNKGAVPEIIRHGETGFIVEAGDIIEATRYVKELPKISRLACRTHVETQFSLGTMLDAYERIYWEKIATFNKMP